MMRTMKKTIKLFGAFQIAIAALLLLSYNTFLNFEIAFLSAMAVIIGSTYSYSRLVNKRLQEHEHAVDDRDVLEKIDDPFDLYSEESRQAPENSDDVDMRALIKEEKKRMKPKTLSNTKQGAPAFVSLYRLIPYAILIMGFIGLNNNAMLMLWPYLLGLGTGILAGLLIGREVFTPGSTEY